MNKKREGDVIIDRINEDFIGIPPFNVLNDEWEDVERETVKFVEDYNKVVEFIDNGNSNTFFDYLPYDRFDSISDIIREEYLFKITPLVETALSSQEDIMQGIVTILYELMYSPKDVTIIINRLTMLFKQYMLRYVTTLMTKGYWDASFIVLDHFIKNNDQNELLYLIGDLSTNGLYGNLHLLLDKLETKKFVSEKHLRIIIRSNYIKTFNILVEHGQVLKQQTLNYALYDSKHQIAEIIFKNGVNIKSAGNINTSKLTAFIELSTITSAFLSLNHESVNQAIEMGCSFNDFSFFGFINFYYRLLEEHTPDSYHMFFEPYINELFKSIEKEVNYYYKHKKDYRNLIELNYPHSVNSSIAIFSLLPDIVELKYRLTRRIQLGALLSTNIDIWQSIFDYFGYPVFGLISARELVNKPVFNYLIDFDPNFTNIDPKELFKEFNSFVDAYPIIRLIFYKNLPPDSLRDKYDIYLNENFIELRERDYYDRINFKGSLPYSFEEIMEFYYLLGLVETIFE